MRTDKPPFELGETLSGKDDNDNLINSHWLGQKFLFPPKPDDSNITGNFKRRTGRGIVAMPVRNISGATLYGKRLCLLDAATAGLTNATGGIFTTKGYATETGQANVAVIDEFIATSGVADDDIFWAILEGPVLVKTQATPGAATNISAGDKMIGGTGAASSQSTGTTNTAGGVGTTSAPLVTQLIGTALSAMATASTQEDVLMMTHIHYV